MRINRLISISLLAVTLLLAFVAMRAPASAIPDPGLLSAEASSATSIIALADTLESQPTSDVSEVSEPTAEPIVEPDLPAATEEEEFEVPIEEALPEVTPTPSVEPTPTPRPAGTPPRVGIQVGHLNSHELPEELARLRSSTGARAGGYTEAEVNHEIAKRVAALLEAQGFIVDLIPATVPVQYDADAFVAIHADGSSSTAAHGYKIATPWRASRASEHLLDSIRAEYAAATNMPWDDAITVNMRGYYAFNYRRHQHAVGRTTPAVIVETGFLTNPSDRALLTQRPDVVAAGIANGIVRYFNERDPNDGAALLPPEFRTQRPISPDGVDVRTAPRDNAPLLVHADADQRFNPLSERDGWYQVFVRVGETRTTGWVRADQLTSTNDPTPTPPPSTDS
jgi:hypothetical protein